MEFSSKILEEAVLQFSKLPGIGKKTALRHVLSLIKQDKLQIDALITSLQKLKDNLILCQKCHNLSDSDICNICSNPRRNEKLICVVEDVKDVMALENTHQFSGLYHVLGGLISPLDGIGPDQLTIEQLFSRIEIDGVEELIFALSATIEGDTTTFYISKKIDNLSIKLSTLARGISVGGELEYADEVTLARSIYARVPYIR